MRSVMYVLVFVLSVIAFGFLLSWPVMVLWNECLVGAVAGVAKIGWTQAWGILILCGLLFKSHASSKE